MPAKQTPLLEQYRRIKQQHEGALLLFRVGDFYEMFYEDAEAGARALGLTLTSRPHGTNNRVPLAGVPAKSLDTYVGRLVAQGFKIAICEQLEPPSSHKPVVRREVVEVITPGTLTRPGLLDEKRNNYLMALAPAGGRWGLAFADVSTGEFRAGEVSRAALAEEIQKIEPREILLPESFEDTADSPDVANLTRLDDWYFTQDFAFDRLTSHFGVANLEGFGVAGYTEGICAAGAVLHYLEETQKNALPHVTRIAPYVASDHLLVDRISRRNLELVERIHPLDGASRTRGTLCAVLDRTTTPAGGRLLRRWLLAPLLDIERIRARHEAVAELVAEPALLSDIQDSLSGVGDLERVASRIGLERASARDLVALKDWLKHVPGIRGSLETCHAARLAVVRNGLEDFSGVVADIETVLVDDPPLALADGGIIREGHSRELDELRDLASNAKSYIADLQRQERERTGIPNLKVGYNSVFGYYLEVTKSHISKVPKTWLRKQTLVNSERYITPELKDYESKVLNAEERIKKLEQELFNTLRSRLGTEVPRLLRLSELLSELDVLAAFARVARENRYVRPEVDNSGRIEIQQGRHPVVETFLDTPFIANDTDLDCNENQVLIITGPNMAGKSTYLRQVALLAIMAQTGSFVPARSARIGVVDKVFTRIGASDDLAQGVSTFLAEMTETANILNNATSRSLVVLDEVGRGTATNDGLAIAWAAVEYLHGPADRRPRTLFATHYHELSDIAGLLPRVSNHNFSVREKQDGVVFLRKLKPGPASRSYGIAVARLAGLPDTVIERARAILATFEQGERESLTHLLPGIDGRAVEPLLAADRPISHPTLDRLREIDLEQTSPLKALQVLSELQRQVRENS